MLVLPMPCTRRVTLSHRKINWRLTAPHTIDRRVHEEHDTIFQAAIRRQDARSALALEAHIRLTHDIIKRETKLA